MVSFMTIVDSCWKLFDLNIFDHIIVQSMPFSIITVRIRSRFNWGACGLTVDSNTIGNSQKALICIVLIEEISHLWPSCDTCPLSSWNLNVLPDRALNQAVVVTSRRKYSMLPTRDWKIFFISKVLVSYLKNFGIKLHHCFHWQIQKSSITIKQFLGYNLLRLQ